MYPKVTSILEDQSKGNGVKKGKKSTIPDSAMTLSGQDLFMGSLLFMTKSANSPRYKSNLFMHYNTTTGRMVPTPEIMTKTEQLDELLRASTDNALINPSDNDVDNQIIIDDTFDEELEDVSIDD